MVAGLGVQWLPRVVGRVVTRLSLGHRPPPALSQALLPLLHVPTLPSVSWRVCLLRAPLLSPFQLKCTRSLRGRGVGNLGGVWGGACRSEGLGAEVISEGLPVPPDRIVPPASSR